MAIFWKRPQLGKKALRPTGELLSAVKKFQLWSTLPKRRTHFIVADSDAESNTSVNLHMTRVVLSTNWYGRSMLITASLDFIYIRPVKQLISLIVLTAWLFFNST